MKMSIELKALQGAITLGVMHGVNLQRVVHTPSMHSFKYPLGMYRS